MTRKIAVTGVGLVTPIGSGKKQFWDAAVAGKSGVAPVSSFDTSAFPVHLGAEVKDFQPELHCRRRPAEDLGRASQLAIAAARMAIEDAGLDLDRCDRTHAGVSMGTTSGEPLFVEQYNDVRKQRGLEAIPAGILPRRSPLRKGATPTAR